MNWGYKILFVYLAFVVGILFLVFKVSGEKDDLVTADYYAQELKYQQRIDATNRGNALSAEVQEEVLGNRITLHFPKEFLNRKISGKALLYCPADENKDVNLNFSTSDGEAYLNIPNGRKGFFELQLNWEADSVTYYSVKKITL